MPQPEPSLEIASLIDICFLLLIYFIVTCTLVRENDLGMALPKDGYPDPASRAHPVVIRVEANGTILTGAGAAAQAMDADPSRRELPLLRSHLEMIAAASRAAGTSPLVKLDADDEASQQRVIDVLNTLAAVGITAVTFSDALP
jgi:biopolymer transport protein ExbD